MKNLFSLVLLLSSTSAFADCSEKAVTEIAMNEANASIAEMNQDLKSIDAKSGVTLTSMSMGGKFYLSRATVVAVYELRFYGEVNETKNYARTFAFTDACKTLTSTVIELTQLK